MRVTWMGHACFVLEQDGFRIVIDPYTGIPGYPPLALEADRVECSHSHFDHNAVSAVHLRPGAGAGPFTVEEIPTFHDGAGGALRGGNTVRIFSAGGVRVCHMGDIGHPLSAAQAAAVGPWAGSTRWTPPGRNRSWISCGPGSRSPCTTATRPMDWKTWPGRRNFCACGPRRR